MKRPLEVGVLQDEETGEVYLDKEDAAHKLMFLLDCLEHFGGGFSVVALRNQVGDDQFEPAGLRIQYESFVPARRVPSEPEPEPVAEPVAA